MNDNPQERAARVSRDQDEIAKAVGHALDTWTSIELYLAELFAHASEMPHEGDIPLRPMRALAAIVSFDARLALVTAIVEEWKFNYFEFQAWKRISAKVQKAQKRRNKIAHFRIETTFTLKGGKEGRTVAVAPYYTLPSMMDHARELLSVSDIESMTEKFRELAAAISWFAGRAAKLAGRPPVSPPQESPLVERTLADVVQTHEEQVRRPQPSER